MIALHLRMGVNFKFRIINNAVKWDDILPVGFIYCYFFGFVVVF